MRGRARSFSVEAVDARLVLAAIVVLAVAVRLAGIESRLHNDDAFSWLVASAPSPHVFLRQLAASENTPPLFYVLLAPLPVDQPVWLRLPAALAGVLMCVVLFTALRRRLGDRAALLAALAVAVSPFLVTYSDLARGFMLANLALLVCLWGVLRLSEEESIGWWAIFLLGGVVAIYTEYSSALFLLALIAVSLWIGEPKRSRMVGAGGLVFLALVPWIPQIFRGQDQVHVTKLNPMVAVPSLSGLRDAALTLALGESGGTASSLGRWLEFGVLLALGGAAGLVLRRGWRGRDAPGRQVIVVIAGTAALTLVAHLLAGAVGVGVFTQRYMTSLIPLAAGLAAVALVSLERRALLMFASAVLVGLGIAGVARRYRGQWEPDFAPVRLAALAAHPRSVLTNTPLVLYYLPSLHPQFDRPYNLGSGHGRSCARPCLIIDDSRVPGGSVRSLASPQQTPIGPIGPFHLTLER